MTYQLIGHTDGASRGNPGPAGAGVVISDADGRERETAALFLGRVTNNVAEYRALGEAVRLAAEVCRRDGVSLSECRLVIYTDSELMARQVSGQYQMKSPDLKPLLAAFRRDAAPFAEVRVVHVPRAKNARADALANQAIDRGLGGTARQAVSQAAAPAAPQAAAPAAPQAAAPASFSRLSHLECSACGRAHDAEGEPGPNSEPARPGACPACGRPLLARYRLEGLTWPPPDRYRSMWRYHELLPVTSPERVVSLGEGGTPVVPIALGRGSGRLEGLGLWFKDEGLNPTGTFKARGASACVSRLVELGVTRIAIPTAGNAGAAFAAYAARAGVTLTVALPDDTPPAIRRECEDYGAAVQAVAGLLPDAARHLRQSAASPAPFIAATFDEPWRVEGKKTIGFELFESLGGRWPDAVLCPVGGGVALVAIWKAAKELAAAGVVAADRMPRLFAVQAEGCAPIVRAYAAGRDDTEAFPGADTVAVGLRVPSPKAGFLVLRAVRETGGAAVAVSDAAILDAAAELRRTAGLDPAPEGAAAWAALAPLADQGHLDGCADVVVLNTGAGLKYR